MGSEGFTTINFGSTPTDEASIAVTGQAGIVAGSDIEAFWQGDTASGNGVDEHLEGGAMCKLVCGSVIAGTGFTITAYPTMALATGTFKIHWVWN
jgi:hypothetical protein